MKSCGVRIRGFSWPPTQHFFFEQLLASQTHFKVPRISGIPLAADELCFLGFRSEYVCQYSKLQKHPSSNCYPQFLLVTFESPLNHEDVCLSKLALYELLTNPSRFAVDFLHGSPFPLRFVDSPLSSCSWQMTSHTMRYISPKQAANRQIGKSSEPKQLRWNSWTVQHGASIENYCFLKAWNQSRK